MYREKSQPKLSEVLVYVSENRSSRSLKWPGTRPPDTRLCDATQILALGTCTLSFAGEQTVIELSTQ